MKNSELKQKIIDLKKQTNTLILAHTYQDPDIIDIADVTGDSFALSKAATKYDNPNVLMCGVRFMAETVKILSPEKKVILSHKNAGCPMAEQIDPERVRKFKEENPDVCVCAYINTTTALKTVCDICVTSSTAVKIVKKIEQKDILFIPDMNLGSFVKNNVPEKNIILWEGCCPTHHSITLKDVEDAKALHPDALIAMHPECRPEVAAKADMLGSTSAIIDFCNDNPDKEIIIATERGVYDYLTREYPERKLWQLAPKKLICSNMKKTTLQGVYDALNGNGGDIIELDENTRLAAKKCIDNMLAYGG